MTIQFSNYREKKEEVPKIESFIINRSNKIKNEYKIVNVGQPKTNFKIETRNGLDKTQVLIDKRYLYCNKFKKVYDPCRFFDKGLIKGAIFWAEQYKLNVLGMLCMYANESAWGASIHCNDNNNIFNIKDFDKPQFAYKSAYSYASYDPNEIGEKNTWYYGYNNLNDACEGYGNYLTKNDNFKECVQYYSTDISWNGYNKALEYWIYLKSQGYSTADANYEGILKTVLKYIGYLYG